MMEAQSQLHDEGIASNASTIIDEEKTIPRDVPELEGDHPELKVDTLVIEPAPDGGLRAWLVAAGSCTIFFCCLGFANSFGTFEEYYLTHQLHRMSPDDIAWIGSISSFLSFAVGMIAGPLFDRYGVWVIRPAAILYIFAMMMLSLCKEYWQFMLVQGVLMGIVMGLLQFPAFGAVAQYFDKKRAAALGIVVSGSSLGGIVIPIVISKLLNGSSLGFAWSVRIVGFMFIPFLLFSLVTVKARLPPRTTNFWVASAFKNRLFLLLVLSAFFAFIGMLTPIFYLPSYAVSRGINPSLAGYFLAILNAASTFGRIIPGLLADKYGRVNMFAFGTIATAITIFCMNRVTSTASFVVYAIVFGFFSGTIISGSSAAFSICPTERREIGTYIGFGFGLAGIGALIGPPVNGALLSAYGEYFEVFMFSGAVCSVAGIIAVLAKFATPQGIFGKV